MARTKLDAAKVKEGVARLSGWEADSDTSIAKEFKFKNHIAALGFVVQVATTAETLDHHPEVHWVYNKVTLTLSTHDAGGITANDFELAEKIDTLV